MSDQWIRASEISTYVYCQRAWWLRRRQGAQPQNIRQLQQGTQYHQQHGRLVDQSRWSKRLAYALLFIAIAVFVYQLVLSS